MKKISFLSFLSRRTSSSQAVRRKRHHITRPSKVSPLPTIPENEEAAIAAICELIERQYVIVEKAHSMIDEVSASMKRASEEMESLQEEVDQLKEQVSWLKGNI